MQGEKLTLEKITWKRQKNCKKKISLIFSLNCDDRFERKYISRENLKLPWSPSWRDYGTQRHQIPQNDSRCTNTKSRTIFTLFNTNTKSRTNTRSQKSEKCTFCDFSAFFTLFSLKSTFHPASKGFSQISTKLKEFLTKTM